jgi:RNA polymerase sigma factor (sigma-70 family)
MRDREEQLEDEILVLRAQDGEAEAFCQIVSRWQNRFWRHAARMIRDGDAAWDVVQEAWIAIIGGLGRLDDPAAFSTWAYRIVTRRCVDWVRRRARLNRLTEDLFTEPPRDANPRDLEEIEGLRKAIHRLDPDHRAVLSLHYVEGYSIEQMAKILDIPAGTVKSRLHHIRNDLKFLLQEDQT